MPGRACPEVLLCSIWLALASCRSPAESVAIDSGSAPAAAARPASADAPAPAASASGLMLTPAASASVQANSALPGHASLVLERVDTKSGCGGGFVGFDVLLEVKEGEHPLRKEHVFCPDGPRGPQPSLNMFRMCRSFPQCQILAPDAAGSVALSCDKEQVRLSISGGRTILSGSFGERDVASAQLSLSVERRWRSALVDC